MAFGIITVHHILNDNFEFDKRYINFVVCDNWDKDRQRGMLLDLRTNPMIVWLAMSIAIRDISL